MILVYSYLHAYPYYKRQIHRKTSCYQQKIEGNSIFLVFLAYLKNAAFLELKEILLFISFRI